MIIPVQFVVCLWEVFGLHRFLIPEGPHQQALSKHPTDGAAHLVSSLQNWEVNEPFVTKQCALGFHYSTRKQTSQWLTVAIITFLGKAKVSLQWFFNHRRLCHTS